ncbi:MAG TPA: T9SS type A sorting domain-containing protein [Puia sp.]|nr:T9SS type A sorting domain-containing protein [Puia sp.]
MAQTHVQTTTKFQNPSTSNTITCTFASASTSGDLIVVHLDWDAPAAPNTRTVSTITDNKGNTYNKINGTTNWNGNNFGAELWYAYNITGGAGAITITAKLSNTTKTFFQIYISEYSGVTNGSDPLDQNAVAIGGTAAVSSGNKTTTQANELVYGASIGATAPLSAGLGFTSRSTANQNVIEDKNVGAAGSYAATFTSTPAGNWVAQMATFTTSNIILPVDLQSFTGSCKNNSISLEWITAAETNNDFFTVEQSPDGESWNVIGTVKSQGSSSVARQYSFTANSAGSTNYFRLKQTDFNGKSAYFKVIEVNGCSASGPAILIYPNPSSGSSLSGKISRGDDVYTLEVFDNTGSMVYRSSSVPSVFTVNFPKSLSTGMYYARFSAGNYSAGTCFLVSR